MSHPQLDNLKQTVASAQNSYERLVLIVGESGAGKTKLLQSLATSRGISILNLTLVLAEALLDLPISERTGHIKQILRDQLQEKQKEGLALLDNTELLFETHLQCDPLRLFRDLSREITLVATWSGKITGNSLEYATHGHPEHIVSPTHDLHLINLVA